MAHHQPRSDFNFIDHGNFSCSVSWSGWSERCCCTGSSTRLTGKNKEASKEGRIHYTTVLVKHAVLDIGDFNASFLNGVHNILGKDNDIYFHLVSATAPDPVSVLKF
ncbi:hypothetical protein QYE76_062634 [Lolium multiflorum]|uniref:Uncharacterized protein n=1 Tax=Lolium multiflorum TaxID=4521 RepID=A0AAD8S3Z1_LOLMU|nr:hypothetical protein QYE76_062634 [Lolium multiflorum]